MATLDDPWSALDYTPITPEAKANLRRMWKSLALPEVALDDWSLEFGREVWSVVIGFTNPESGLGRDELLVVLDGMGAFDPDGKEQKWAPTKR